MGDAPIGTGTLTGAGPLTGRIALPRCATISEIYFS
jgi:hypothetical protein